MQLRRYLVLGVVFVAALLLVAVANVAAQSGGGDGYLPACPDPSSLGDGTPWPDASDLSYDYILDCGHCVGLYEATPDVAGDDWRVYRDCPSDYVVPLSVTGEMQNYTLTMDDKQPWGRQVKAVLATFDGQAAYHGAAETNGAQQAINSVSDARYGDELSLKVCFSAWVDYCPLDYQWAEVAPFPVVWPGSIQSPVVPALGIQANSTGYVLVKDVQLVFEDSFAGFSCPPRALPTVEPVPDGAVHQCAATINIDHNGGVVDYVISLPSLDYVGAPGTYAGRALAGYDYVLTAGNASALSFAAPAGVDAVTASLVGEQVASVSECVGTWDACDQSGADSWISAPAKSISDSSAFAFRASGAAGNFALDVHLYLDGDATMTSCPAAAVEPTPFPTPQDTGLYWGCPYEGRDSYSSSQTEPFFIEGWTAGVTTSMDDYKPSYGIAWDKYILQGNSPSAYEVLTVSDIMPDPLLPGYHTGYIGWPAGMIGQQINPGDSYCIATDTSMCTGYDHVYQADADVWSLSAVGELIVMPLTVTNLLSDGSDIWQWGIRRLYDEPATDCDYHGSGNDNPEPSPEPTQSSVGWQWNTSVDCEAVNGATITNVASMVGPHDNNRASYTIPGIDGGENPKIECTYYFDPPVEMPDFWTQDDKQYWYTTTRLAARDWQWDEWWTVGGVKCGGRANANQIAGTPLIGDEDGCMGQTIDHVLLGWYDGHNATYTGEVDSVGIWGVGGPAPTPTPAMTSTPVSLPTATPAMTSTPYVYATPNPFSCSEFDWSDSTAGLIDPGIAPDASLEDFVTPAGQCEPFRLFSGIAIEYKDYLFWGDTNEFILPGFEFCVRWVDLPNFTILGFTWSYDWLAIPLLAWLLMRAFDLR